MSEAIVKHKVEFVIDIICDRCGVVMKTSKAVWDKDQYERFTEKGWIVDGVARSHSTCDSCSSKIASEK